MLQYVDGFSCSINKDSGNFVIHFIQNEPIVQDNGDPDVIENQIVSLIMQKDTASALYQILKENFEDENIETEP